MHHMETSMNSKHYGLLLLMAVLSFISMYILMYAMVDTFANVYPNFNQLYMAGLMTTPMIIIELFVMKMMFSKNSLNALIVVGSMAVFIFCWLGIRSQVAISDKQFLKSMIPHHAAAILMCKQAPIQDPEIKALCENILSGQQAEIDQMKLKLEQLER